MSSVMNRVRDLYHRILIERRRQNRRLTCDLPAVIRTTCAVEQLESRLLLDANLDLDLAWLGNADTREYQSDYDRGETIEIRLSAKNNGLERENVRFVLDIADSDGDIYHDDSSGTISTSVTEGATVYASFDWTVPNDAATGQYFILSSLRDSHHFDTVYDTYSENWQWTYAFNVSPRPPDLTISYVNLSDTSSDPGQTITAEFTVENIGEEASALSSHGVYWSTDSTITTSDTLLVTSNTSSIPGDSSRSVSVSIEVPNGAGPGETYYVGVVADVSGTSGEANTENNASSGLAVTVNQQLPEIMSFSINDDDDTTGTRTATLDNTCTNSPTHYMASESSDFSDASWQTYSTTPTFTLSSGAGTKEVYFKVKNDHGESEFGGYDTIQLDVANQPPTLTTVSTLTGATEDAPFTITYADLSTAANEHDPDGDAVSFRIEDVTTGTLTKNGSAATPGTLLGPGESLVWTPAANANGHIDAFEVRAWDGQEQSDTVQVAVDVANDDETYLLHEHWDGTWHDAEKDGVGDTLLCWAASASNALAWTNWGDVAETGPDEHAIFEYFEDHWTDGAGHTENSIHWWFTGEYPLTSPAHVDVAGGKFYPAIPVEDYMTVHEYGPSDIQQLMGDMDTALRAGHAIMLISENPAHSISCWGFDYDPNSQQGYEGIWVTDNEDGSGIRHFKVANDGDVWVLQRTQLAGTDYEDPGVALGSARFVKFVELDRRPIGIIEAPVPPTSLTASDDQLDGIHVSWASSDLAEYYDLYRIDIDDDDPDPSSPFVEGIVGTSYNDESAVFGRTYMYWVKAKNDSGDRGKSPADLGALLNTSPTADSGGPYPICEGADLVLDASGSVAPEPNDSLSFSWDLDNDGQFDDASGVNPTIPWSTLVSLGVSSVGQHPVQLRVHDTGGLTDEDSTDFEVQDCTPSVTVSTPDGDAGEPSDNGVFRITRTGGTDSALTVNFNAPTGSAIRETDYDLKKGSTTLSGNSVTIDAGLSYVDVTVYVRNDDIDEDGELVNLQLASGCGYTLGGTTSGTVTISDDDTAWVIVSPTSGLVTTEAGGTDSFTVRLDSEPTANVTIDLSSSNTSEGMISPTSVTFTPDNWDQPQTMTVTGQQNAEVDGNVAYTIVTGAASSSDPKYNGMAVADVSITNMDVDLVVVPGVPTGVAASDETLADRVCVTWDTVNTASSYEVWRNGTNDSASASKISLQDVPGTSYDDTSASASTDYWYWVKAKNAAGVSEFSEPDQGRRANQSPVVDAGPDATISEGGTFTLDGSFVDPDSANWTIEVDWGDAHNDTWDTAEKIIRRSHVYADNNRDAGGNIVPYVVDVTVTDDEGISCTDCLQVTVDNVAPTVNVIANVIVNEGSLFCGSGSFADPGTDTWTATVEYGDGSGVQNLTLNEDKSFDLSHTYTNNGPHTVTVTVQDDDTGVGSGSLVVTVNAAPLLDPIGNKSVNEEVELTFTATASDQDFPADTLTFSLDAAAIALGMSIDASTGTFSWTPTEAQGGSSYNVTITVTDGSLDDSETIFIAVAEVNVAPLLDEIGNKSVDEQAELTFTAMATDQDLPADTLTFSLDPAAIALGMSITSGGVFSWTPTESQGGNSYDATITVTDDGSPNPNDSETISITVAEVNVAPMLDPIGNKSVDEQVELTFTATATDQDLPAQTLTFSLDPAAIVLGMSITSGGVFSWTPTELQGGGSYDATITVTDDGTPSLNDSETISIAVAEVNVAPVLDPIGNKSVDEEVELTFTATATDQDLPADTLTFSLDSAAIALGMSITSGGVFSWTPTELQGGSSYDATITITDDGMPNLNDSETISITVAEVNVAPALAPIGNKSVDEQAELTFTATATDQDLPADTLTFSLDSAAIALGMSITSGGVFSWTPTELQGGGSYDATIMVTDDGTPNLNDSETISVTVAEVNVAPVLGPIGNKSVDEQAELTFTATRTDQDLPAQTLTFSLDPAAIALGMSIDANTGLFSWTPTETQGGASYNVTITVTDGSLDDSETISIAVEADVEPIDLETVDFIELSGLNLTDGDVWYQLTTARMGELTVIASSEFNSVVATLYDHSKIHLAASATVDEQERLDLPVQAGEDYFLKISGDSSDADLTIANLLTTQGTEILVSGTDGTDSFEFASSDYFDIAINGVEYQFDRTQYETTVFNGDAGEDAATLTGGPADTIARCFPDHATLQESEFLVTVNDVTNVTAYSGGGTDWVSMYDSPDDDEFISRKGYAKLSGTGFAMEAFDFMYNYGYATTKDGGSDVAHMEDSSQNDGFKFCWSESERFFGMMREHGTFYNRAKGFEQIVATMADGENRARLYGSKGDDTFYGQKDESQLVGSGFDVTVSGYDSLVTYASKGHDIAELEDSADDDTARALTHKTVLWGAEEEAPTYKITARGFDEYHIDGKHDGYDRAELHDTALREHVEASGNTASLYRNESDLDLLHEVVAFEWIKLYGSDNGDEDTLKKGEPLDFDLIYDPTMWDELP